MRWSAHVESSKKSNEAARAPIPDFVTWLRRQEIRRNADPGITHRWHETVGFEWIWSGVSRNINGYWMLFQLACAWFQVVAWLPSVWVHYLLRGVKCQHPWTKWIEPKLGSKVTKNARTSTNLKSVAAFALDLYGGTSKRLANVNQKTLQIRVWGVHESRHLLQNHAGESEELLIMAQIKTEDQRILFFHKIWDFLTMKIRTYSGHITVYIYPIFIKISIKIRTS